MKLEYLCDISDGGRYSDLISENLVRLYDFSKQEVSQFQKVIKAKILIEKQSVDIDELDYIENVNCSLKLVLSDLNNGINKVGDNAFHCNMNENSYKHMVDLIQPFTEELSGYNWLDEQIENESNIDFLISPGGGW